MPKPPQPPACCRTGAAAPTPFCSYMQPMRWITSRNTVGRSDSGCVKICRSTPCTQTDMNFNFNFTLNFVSIMQAHTGEKTTISHTCQTIAAEQLSWALQQKSQKLLPPVGSNPGGGMLADLIILVHQQAKLLDLLVLLRGQYIPNLLRQLPADTQPCISYRAGTAQVMDLIMQVQSPKCS